MYCQRNPWTEEIMARLSKHEGSPLRRYYSGLPSINGHLSTLFGELSCRAVRYGLVLRRNYVDT